jgi:hypothetical protein
VENILPHVNNVSAHFGDGRGDSSDKPYGVPADAIDNVQHASHKALLVWNARIVKKTPAYV